MPARPRSRSISVAAVALIALGAILTAPSFSAAPGTITCTYLEAGAPGPAGNVLRIDDRSNSATHVYRKGDEIVVFGNAERDPTVCAGGTPTVFNVDRIEYSTTDSTPFFNYIRGEALAPGATAEPSGSEIEVSVREAYEPGVLNVGGGMTGESIVAGRTGARQIGVNLNAQADGANQDVDYVLEAIDPAEAIVHLVGKSGDDRISDIGGPGFAGPLLADRVSFSGGIGDDTMIGSPGRERMRADAGDDVFLAGAGRDWLTIGAGHDLARAGRGNDRVMNIGDVGGAPLDTETDRIFAGPGNDIVESIQIPQQLGGDLANCGSGRDEAAIDPGDRTKACEKVEVERIQ